MMGVAAETQRAAARGGCARNQKEETTVVLDPGGLIAWMIVGLVAGFLAGRVMKGGSYGLVGDIIMGIIGAFVGGFLAGLLGFTGPTGLIGSIVVAFIGACIFIAIVRALPGRSPV